MADTQPLDDRDREELIAYLDGELTEAETQAIESKLQSDPRWRAEADALRRTWDLLDFLPRPEPSPTFTHRTLNQLTTALRPADSSRRSWRSLGWAAAFLLAAGAGYLASPWLLGPARPAGPAPLSANDERLLDRLRLYEHVDDIHFLRELDQDELFGQDVLSGPPWPRPGARTGDDPQRSGRLQASLARFHSLPAERQQAIRTLDRDLEAVAPAERVYLERALVRYADWLDQLSPADRASVVSGPDRRERLQRIRLIREREWLARQPRATRDVLARGDPGQLSERIRQLRQAELEQQADWQVRKRFWDVLLRNPVLLPSRPEQLPPESRQYLERTLLPLLSRADVQRLDAAQGQWPRYPRLLVELADSHPPALLGPIGPLSVQDLPPAAREIVAKEGPQAAEGKWPDFGVALRDLQNRLKLRDTPLTSPRWMPARPADFPAEVQQFIQQKLLPALYDDERQALAALEGSWPAYPRRVLELADRHNLRPTTEPRLGPTTFWDQYRRRPAAR